MNRFTVGIFLSVAVVTLSGCRTFTDPGDVDRVYRDGSTEVHRISWDATRRGTYIVVKNGVPQFISEPPPDAALETIANIAAKFNVTPEGGFGGEGSVNVTETIKALSRAIEISFLREALYRLGESYVNGGITTTEYSDNLGRIFTLTTLMVISGQQAGNSPDQLDALLSVVSKEKQSQVLSRNEVDRQLSGLPESATDAEERELKFKRDQIVGRIKMLEEAETMLRQYQNDPTR